MASHRQPDVLGPPVYWPVAAHTSFFIKEVGKIAAGDTANLGIWVRHLIGVALTLLLVSEVCDMAALQYLVEFVYPGLVLGMMRSFTEHRWGEQASERTAVVESNWVFGLLFLWNNLPAASRSFPPSS